MTEQQPTKLVLPGYLDSGPGHWQTRWQALDPAFVRVRMPDWDHPSRDAWCRTLAATLDSLDAPVVFAAHSLGCLTTAFWASQYASAAQLAKVAGALLVAVPDPAEAHFPRDATGFAPVPLERLPFATIVVASSDDPYGGVPFSQTCASAWGSRWIGIGARGHINADSGLGDWDEGRGWLASLTRAR
ncbi:putative alpha/beta hydrolase family esterase [Paraburkholderia youngii]|uniref:RBBP9/YdeN family alpha/beta hydrolase n=1 Tax=Paraburkholderia youngii TaxID=2782701 RepID=UPI00158FFB2B|nr:alpha/beta hydrolase [Paraburkholderia youngii]NUX56888.1 alpha/beta hydrolase [Paraburkholderia youngii]